MLNKNDPLIGAVQEVMKKNQVEREAAKLVNEKFGVHDRKALPHEKQGEWDAAYKAVLTEGLHPNQQKLDVHEPEKNKLTAQDFKMLRAKKKPMEEENVPKTDPYAEGQASSISTVSQPKKEITPADQSALKKKIQSIKEENLEEKAVSKAQQRFMGLVRGIQKGKAHGSAKAEKAAETMSAKEVKKYAGTKQKGLPEKVDEATDAASSNAPQVKGQTQYGRYRGVYGSMQAHADAARAPVPSGAAAGSAMGSFKPAASSNDAKIKPFGSGGFGPSPFPKYDPNAAKNAGYAGDTRSKSSPERIANPSFVPRPSPGASALAKKAPTPGGARPSVVAKNTATGSQTSTGAQIGGARPSVVAKNTATAPAARANDTGRAGVPGTGNRLAKPMGANAAPAGGPPSGTSAAKPAAVAPKPTAKPDKPVVKAVRKAAPTAPAKPKLSPLQQQMARSNAGRNEVAGPRKDARGLNVSSMTRPSRKK